MAFNKNSNGYTFLFAIVMSWPFFIWWSYWWASLFFQFFVLLMATFSGANFYIEVHSVSYMQRLQKAENAARKAVEDEAKK